MSLANVIEGAVRFRKTIVANNAAFYAGLGAGQSPHTLFITCSDSRVVPSLFTGAQPGDLFVVRNAGNQVLPFSEQASGAVACSGEQAAVEYAVAVLGVQHIVVCGHTHCGAMGGLLKPDQLAPVPSVARWVEAAQPVRDKLDPSAANQLQNAIETNARHQCDNLKTHPSVAKALAEGKLSLHAWVYDIETGAIHAYDEGKDTFVELNPLSQATSSMTGASHVNA